MKQCILGIGIACSLLVAPAYAKQVELTNKEGKSISVVLLSASQKDVTVKVLGSGKKLTMPLASLSADSKKSIKTWQKSGVGASQDFGISARVRKDVDKGDSKGKKIPPTKLIMGGTVTIKNEHDSLTTAPSMVHTVLLGKSIAKTGLAYVFDVKTAKLGKLAPGASKEIKLRNFKTTYLDDGDKSYGAKYSGYIVYVTNKTGEVVSGKSMPSSLYSKYKDQLKSLQKDAFYDRDWQRIAFKDKHPKNKKK